MMTLLRTSQVRTCEKSAKDYNCVLILYVYEDTCGVTDGVKITSLIQKTQQPVPP